MVKKSGGALLLAVALDAKSERPLASQLSLALRDLILGGALRPGQRLPASRIVAADLGVSRTTVMEAFARLQAEGLIEARVGAGSYVSAALAAHPQPAEKAPVTGRQPRLSKRVSLGQPLIIDRLPHQPRAFTTAMPAFDAFPMGLWARYEARHWRGPRAAVLGYGDPQGELALRRAIAAHLRANRAIAAEPEEIFITHGAQQAFQLIADFLLDPGDAVWCENPGAIGARNCFASAGAKLIPVPVDDEGLVVELGLKQARRFRLAFVTPAHQQPLGSTMSLRRRLALLAAAQASDAWVVEDDYDGEFCYAGLPPPTLKSTDRSDRVFYVGTFAKTLFPALRLGYMLVPKALVESFQRLIRGIATEVSANAQGVVADFMEEGHFAAHIRRMRKLYKERHDALIAAAGAQLTGLIDVMPTDTGLHTVGYLPRGQAVKLAAAAEARHITVVPITRFCLAPIKAHGLVLGFSGINPAEIRRGVAILTELADGLRVKHAVPGKER